MSLLKNLEMSMLRDSILKEIRKKIKDGRNETQNRREQKPKDIQKIFDTNWRQDIKTDPHHKNNCIILKRSVFAINGRARITTKMPKILNKGFEQIPEITQ